MLSICVMSDLHGVLPYIESCDILLICGDIVPLRMQRNKPQCEKWLKTSFADWIKSLPCERVIFIAGNHDHIFENVDYKWINSIITEPTDSKAIYLENSHIDHLSNDGKVYRIYGTPACHIFGNWAFMYSDEKLQELYQNIPEDCDILISHDAPYGVSDICFESYWNKEKNIGNKPLREATLEKSPSYLFHGHLHSSNHELEYLGNTKVYNTSILGEDYSIKYCPLYLDV